jgi:S1-C subfamily serine protease
MKAFRIFNGIGVLAGVATVALLVSAAVHAQQPSPSPNPWIPRGPGAGIGVSVRDVEPGEADRLKVAGGAFVEEVHLDTPAERAGLKRGDVVVEFDGERIRSARQFSRLVAETPPGRTVKATVVRDGQRKDLQVTPSAEGRWGSYGYYFDGDRFTADLDDLVRRMPDFRLDFEGPGMVGRGQLGVTVNPLTPQLASYFGAKEGVLVASVSDDSPAARAGLKAGDVITSINGEGVTSRSDLVQALRGAPSDDVTIGIVRDRKETTVKAKIERRPRPRGAVRPV